MMKKIGSSNYYVKYNIFFKSIKNFNSKEFKYILKIPIL